MPIQKGPANLGTGSVDSTELSNTLDLSAKTVTYRTIVAGDIASNAITTAKITDANITPAKMANSGAEFGMRNRIINGAMVIDQRNAGASVTPTNAQYLTDRFSALLTQASKFTAQQNAGSVTPPAGFINYLGMTSSSAYSIGSGDAFGVLQKIEGLNVADFGWGTANAKTVTLSFQVYSSLTGTFGGSILNSAVTRSYPFTYTISSANTWTSISVTIAGDTSGTWLTTNGIGININFSLGTGATYNGTAGAWAGAYYLSATGATSVVGTSGATFYITGVQLEKGSTATSFDYRPYGTELALCQRYYEKSYNQTDVPGTSTITGAISFIATTTGAYQAVFFKVPKRATAATMFIYGSTGVQNTMRNVSSSTDLTATAGNIGEYGYTMQNTVASAAAVYAFQYAAQSEL